MRFKIQKLKTGDRIYYHVFEERKFFFIRIWKLVVDEYNGVYDDWFEPRDFDSLDDVDAYISKRKSRPEEYQKGKTIILEEFIRG